MPATGELIDTSSDALLASLERVYTERGKEAEFKTEKPIYAQLLPILAATLKPLVLSRAFALGSTATVWEVEDRNLNQKRALKLPRPRLGKLHNIIRVFTAEKNTLARLTHQNIIKIYLSDELPIVIEGDNYSFPFFLMDYLEGVKDLDDYIIENLNSFSAEAIISYFRHIALGLSFLHTNGIVHCDIKPGNVIIAPDSPALIADLGYSKHFSMLEEGPEKLTTVTYTPPYAHPRLIKKMTRSSDSAANISEIKRIELTPAFDLFAFGRTLQEILNLIKLNEESEDVQQSIFSPYQWRYLALIAVRLLDGEIIKNDENPLQSDVIPGLPGGYMKELAYKSADEALEDLEKLLNLYDLEGEIPELNSNLSTYIQIPGSRVPFTRRVSQIINHPAFVRLTHVTQLGFVSLVYPGATHNRAEHSLGTFEKCCEVVRALWYDEVNCVFRSIMSRSNIEALLLASLLHDIGHYPMAHDLSEAFDVFAHDKFTDSMLMSLDSYLGRSLADIIRAEWETTADDVLSILKADSNSLVRQRILHSIISGPLDTDKLDYLDRDSLHTGVSFGGDIDRGRLLRSLTVCFSVTGADLQTAEVGVTEKAHTVGESIWRARLEMFRQVYWHHTVRSLKAMLTYVVRRIILKLIEDDKLSDFCCSLNQFCLSPLSSSRFTEDIGQMQEQSQSESLDNVVSGLEFDIASRIEFSHLSPSDDTVISFLWTYADTYGRNVLEMIRRRQLYKRVAILSYSIQKDVFTSIYNRYRHERIHRYIKALEDWRADLESTILSECRTGSQEDFLWDDLAQEFPIILFDVPLKALREPESTEALWYVPEERLGRDRKKVFGKYFVAQSKVAMSSTTFDKVVGKIRVFAHPGLQDVILKKMDNEKIIQKLLKPDPR